MNKEEFKKAIEDFARESDFELNPDASHLENCLEGIMANENRYGIKYCPCRVVEGDFSKDNALICPCNFKVQDCWRDEDRCWCGLFTKKK